MNGSIGCACYSYGITEVIAYGIMPGGGTPASRASCERREDIVNHAQHTAPASMHPRSRIPLLLIASLVLTLLSSGVRRTRLEVQDWDCPPAPASCARPVVVRGFPLSYVSDYHGISVVGDASLFGALLGEDHFRPWSFFADVAFHGVVVAVLHALASRVRPRRS